MIPYLTDDLRQDFTFTTLPGRTFKLNEETKTCSGMTDGLEAVKQAIYLILNTERYQWLIFSWDYGVEFRRLYGKDVRYCVPEIERRIREALLQDDRITAVQNFQFSTGKGIVTVSFVAVTIYGKANMETEVVIANV